MLLLARLIGQCCFVRWCLLSVCRRCRRLSSVGVVVVCRGLYRRRRAGRRARQRLDGRHSTAGQYGYVPLGRHLAITIISYFSPLTAVCLFMTDQRLLIL